jgi:hypothetical protein
MAKDQFSDHPRIQIALVIGVSILTLAWASRRVLPEPLGTWELLAPTALALVHVAIAKTRPRSLFARPAVGGAFVLAATVLIILLNTGTGGS